MERFAGRYLLLRPLGRGGMGNVHLARDLASGSECALKRISSNAPDIAPELLRKEFEVLARVRHPAVVEVHDLGVAADGTAYITMDYVPGLPADRVLRQGDWASLVFVAAQVAAGLQAIHSAGVIHGDLKPSNLLVTPGESQADLPINVRLVDFGLAGLLGEIEGHRGTPGFAAPEVVAGGSPSVASDLYGLGATLYQLISGRPPFADEKSGALLQKQQTSAPSVLPLEESGCPAPLAQLVLRLMAVAPAERPSDAREVRVELERVHPAARRPLAERLETTIVVGRERELAQLERRLTEASRRSRMVIMSGEPGSGKTTLLGELSKRAVLAGNHVVRCSAGASVEPGHAALVLLRAIAGVASVVEGQAKPDSTLLDPARTSMSSDDVDGLVRVAVAQLAALSTEARAPLVLIDDAETLDEVSRNAIRRIMLAPDAPSALWVLARRGDAGSLAEDDKLLQAAGHAEAIAIEGLDADGVSNLIAARLGDAPPEGLAEAILSRTAGHPGLSVEALRCAAESGALREGDVGLIVDRAKLDALRLPRSFEQSRLEKLASLPDAAQRLAEFLSTVGRAVNVDDIPGEAVDDPEEAVSALAGSGLGARQDGTIVLQPPALAEAILGRVDAERAAELHRAAAGMRDLGARERFEHLRALGDIDGAIGAAEQAFGSSREPQLATAAADVLRDTDPVSAAMWFDRAADVLLERGRLAEAAPLLDAALELDSKSDAKFERWIKAADAWARVGDAATAQARAEEGLANAPPRSIQVVLLTARATSLRFGGKLDEASATLDEAQRLVADLDDDRAIARVLHTRTALETLQENFTAAIETAAAATAAFERLGDERMVVAARNNVAIAARAVGDYGRAMLLAKECLELARGTGHRHLLLRQLILAGTVQIDGGDWDAARAAFDEGLRLALEDGAKRSAALSMSNLAQLDGLTGRPRQATARGKRALSLARKYEKPAVGFAMRSVAQGLRVIGAYPRAERVARRALAAEGVNHYPGAFDWGRLEVGRTLEAQGRSSEARQMFEMVVRHHTDRSAFCIASAHVGILQLNEGQAAAGAETLATLQAYATSHELSPYARAWIHTLRACVRAAEGNQDEVHAAAEGALKAFAALPAPWDRASAALILATTCRRHGQSGPSLIEWLHTASESFARLGDHRGRERALALLVGELRDARPAAGASVNDRGLIDDVAWLLSSLAEPKELAQRAMKMAVDAMDAERGVLLQIDTETDRLIPVAEHGALDPSTRQEALGYSRRVVQRVTESGIGMVLGDAVSDPALRSESVVNLNLRSIVCVPMHLGGRTIGAVYLDDSRRPEAFSDQDRGLLEGFAQLMAIAIDRSRGHAEVVQTNERLVGENLSLRREVSARYQTGNVIGSSSQMHKVLATVTQAAQVSSTVMITGEMGTGKELIARTLHHTGKRKLRPFLAVNCGAMPETLIASELFGILPNVATDVHARPGRFVEADGGTLFLDEVGEMPLSQQVALLSVLANREVTPVGGGKPIPVDVRVITASNRDLREQVEKGEFRPDLFYRLNVIQIDIPPLRDRKADIPTLAHYFLAQFAEEQDRAMPEMSPEFVAALMQSDWKGNVRELQNYIERILAMNPGPVLYPDPPPRDLEERAGTVQLKGRRPLPEMVEELEKRMVREALERANGNQSRAARDLGITEQSIRYRLKKFGLDSVRGNRRTR